MQDVSDCWFFVFFRNSVREMWIGLIFFHTCMKFIALDTLAKIWPKSKPFLVIRRFRYRNNSDKQTQVYVVFVRKKVNFRSCLSRDRKRLKFSTIDCTTKRGVVPRRYVHWSDSSLFHSGPFIAHLFYFSSFGFLFSFFSNGYRQRCDIITWSTRQKNLILLHLTVLDAFVNNVSVVSFS